MGPYSEYTGERERLPEIAFLCDPPEPLKVACSMQCALQSLQTAAHCCRGHEARTETGSHREQYFSERIPPKRKIFWRIILKIVCIYGYLHLLLNNNVSVYACRMVSPAAGWRLVSAACLVWPSLAQAAACSTHCSTAGPGCSSSWILSLINQDPEVTSPPPRPTPAS